MARGADGYNGIRDLDRFPRLAGSEIRESDSVAKAAFEHLGKTYRITRELQPGLVDCSTVVSQAHWVGAAIQTPFIAETQLRAANAVAVDIVDLLPGDAIYAYPSYRDSPGGRHNHVVLYLGKDYQGIPRAIESREESGATIIGLDAVRFDGGIRRFCVQPFRTFPGGDWTQLVRRVPKLGRLGCRLTARYGSSRRHQGTDIYAEHDWVMISPFDGMIAALFKTSERSDYFVGISSAEKGAYSLIGPVRLAAGIKMGAQVGRGQLLGGPGVGGAPGGCNTIPHAPGAHRIHWEHWSRMSSAVSPAGDLRCDWLPRHLPCVSGLRSQNVLYELKCGELGTCLRRAG